MGRADQRAVPRTERPNPAHTNAALKHDGDPLPGSPSLTPLNASTAGLGALSGDQFRGSNPTCREKLRQGEMVLPYLLDPHFGGRSSVG